MCLYVLILFSVTGSQMSESTCGTSVVEGGPMLGGSPGEGGPPVSSGRIRDTWGTDQLLYESLHSTIPQTGAELLQSEFFAADNPLPCRQRIVRSESSAPVWGILTYQKVGVNLRPQRGSAYPVSAESHAVEVQDEDWGPLDPSLDIEAHVQVPAWRVDVKQLRTQVHRGQDGQWRRHWDTQGRRILT